MVMTNLDSQFAGLYGLAYSCAVRGNARPLGTPYNMAAAVEQDFQLACIPVFQFAIFYTMDLEINPGRPDESHRQGPQQRQPLQRAPLHPRVCPER